MEVKGVVIAMVASVATATAFSFIREARLSQFISDSMHKRLAVAAELKQRGVREGDSVGYIGVHLGPIWARLARVRIVSEMTEHDAPQFWTAEEIVRSDVIRAFERTGAKLIVADRAPEEALQAGWERIGNTHSLIYLLPSR